MGAFSILHPVPFGSLAAGLSSLSPRCPNRVRSSMVLFAGKTQIANSHPSNSGCWRISLNRTVTQSPTLPARPRFTITSGTHTHSEHFPCPLFSVRKWKKMPAEPLPSEPSASMALFVVSFVFSAKSGQYFFPSRHGGAGGTKDKVSARFPFYPLRRSWDSPWPRIAENGRDISRPFISPIHRPRGSRTPTERNPSCPSG